MLQAAADAIKDASGGGALANSLTQTLPSGTGPSLGNSERRLRNEARFGGSW
jgi:hypothetical protein